MYKRWIQFGSAIVAMIMIANLQYAWTLFVRPLQAAHKDGRSMAFSSPLLSSSFLKPGSRPVEGWMIDRLGPRIFSQHRGRPMRPGLDRHGICPDSYRALRVLCAGGLWRGICL